MKTSATEKISRPTRRLAGGLLVSALAVLAASTPALGLPMRDDLDPVDRPGPVIEIPPPTTTPPTTIAPAADFTIRGTIWIGGPPVFTTGDGPSGPPPLPCNATPSQVTVSAVRGSVTKTVKPAVSKLPIALGGWGYQFTGLTRGTWKVTARLDAGVCQYGTWSPASRSVAPTTTAANPVTAGVEFSYHMPTKITRVPGNIAAGLMDAALNGTELHLDNFGPQHGLSHHEANASFLRWGGSSTSFTIPEKQYDLDCGLPCPDAGQARLYVNDVNLNSVDVGWDTNAFVLDAGFEDSGREVKGFQSYDSYWDYLDFVTDDTVPDFQISDANLRLRLVPVADGAGRLTYSLAGSDFTGTIQATGGCDIFGIDICEFAIGYKATLEQSIESNVSTVLNSATAKTAVGNALKPRLADLGITVVTAVHIDGDDIVIAS